MLVAVTISGFLAVCLGASLSEQLRLSSTSQNQLLAAALADQAVERVRATPFSQLQVGSYPIQVASADSQSTFVAVSTDPMFLRPLQVDGANFTYLTGNTGNNMPTSKFTGTVELSIGSGPENIDSLRTINVLVSWAESGASANGAKKTYQLTSLVCRDGIQWNGGN